MIVKKYIVQRGDSLWAIAEKELGSGAKYTEIVKQNKMKSNVIHPGQILEIPIEYEPTLKDLVNKCVKSVENLPEFQELVHMLER